MRYRIRFTLTAIVLGVMVWLGSAHSAIAQPCYSGFTYRLPIEVDNSLNASLTNYEVKLEVPTSALISAGKMKSLGQDIRFLDGQGNQLNYWIKDGTINTTSTIIWVSVDSLRNYSKDTLYMFYGNSTALPKSDAKATFQFIDEFNGSSLSSAWSSCGSGTVAVSGGKLKLTSNSNTARITTSSYIKGPAIIELQGVVSSGGTAFVGQINTSGSGYAISHDGTNMQMASVYSGASCLNQSAYGSTASTTATGDWSFVWNGFDQKAVLPGNTLSTNNTTYTITGQTKMMLANNGSFGTLEIDYMRVRKYSPNEPNVVVGKEQNMNFSITATYESPLCAGGVLQLKVDTIAGARYAWKGPNGFTSSLQNPQVTGVSTTDAGRYDLTVEIPSGCASKSTSVNVNISPKAVGGTVSGTQTVCAGSNSGVLSLSGHTGNVVRWDSSTSASGPWIGISNTGLNQSYSNLSHSTYFRAIVGNGSCSIDSSTVVKITVTPPSNGGLISGSDTVCATANSGSLTISNHTGNVLRWESSANGNLWTPITNKGTVQAYKNLTQTTYYRAAVQNGNCNIAYSQVAIIGVDPVTIGGNVTGGTTVCPDINSGWLVLNGQRGEVVRWEVKANGTSVWSSITNTNDSLAYSNLGTSVDYRALVKNGSCGAEVSSTASITVLSRSNAGIITGGKEVCETGNSGTLTLTNVNGSVSKWQYSTRTTGWTDITNSTKQLTWYNLSDTTYYRAIVANGSCKPDTSTIGEVLVNPASDGGYISGVDEVCVGGNSFDLTTNATVGNVVDWETSANGYAPWTSVGQSSTALNQKNITSVLYYRTKVKSGTCAAKYSTPKKVEVSALSDAGSIVQNLKVCEGTNFGIIKISKATGDVVNWQKTNSLSDPWTDVANNTLSYEVQNISNTLYVRAVVKNGSCASDTSAIGAVEVSKYSDAGDMYGNRQLCDELNSGNVEIKNQQGDVLYWELSENNGANWNRVVSDQPVYTYTNLSTTTWFRAVVKNGVCPQEESQLATVELSAPSKAGLLKVAQSDVCMGNNSGVIRLEDHQGEILSWEEKKPGGTWKHAVNQGQSLNFTNITEAVRYRAIVKNNFCESDTTAEMEITVSPVSIAGTITGDAEACQNVGRSILRLKGEMGKIETWQSANSEFGPWIDLSSGEDSLILDNSGTTKFYRVGVTSGTCPTAFTPVFRHIVFEKTLAGVISGGRDICTGKNEGVLELNGYVGDILGWEIENKDGGWSSIGFDGDLYWFQNVDESTTYRARIKNGVCDEAVSQIAKLEAHPMPVVSFNVTNPCEDQEVGFASTTTIEAGQIDDVSWRLSDGFETSDASFKKIFQLPGTYVVNLTATSDMGCIESLRKEVTVYETPNTLFRVNNGVTQNSGCLGVDIQFEDLTSYSDKTNLEFVWDFGNGETATTANPVTRFKTSGNFEVELEVRTRNSCSDAHTFDFQILDEIKPQANDDLQASLGIGTQLEARGSVDYHWQPEAFLSDPYIANPIATVTENTLFVVTGTDYYGCQSSDSVWVMVNEDYTVTPANVITPDNNNENDVWVVQNLENYPVNEVSIFDRWGREVYTTKGYNNDWGATGENGKLLMDGTYYYVLEFPEVGKVLKGAITVVRNN
ncbi:MAG: DUF2341 domain-containing protein [Bacteroidia bacterium]|nr:DUF2341 domain-containing protein [Bacteroidia bacterium]